MERFRLRVLSQASKGLIWELKLFPDHPGRAFREKDGRIMGSSSVPATILWLRQLSAPYLKRAAAPSPIEADQFGPESEPRWLEWEDGLRLSLAFANARYLRTPRQQRMFREDLHGLPSEVVLYWFTLCFYGYRQSAGKAAFRTLLTYSRTDEDPPDHHRKTSTTKKTKSKHQPPLPFVTIEDTLPGLAVQDPTGSSNGRAVGPAPPKKKERRIKNKETKSTSGRRKEPAK